MKAIYDKPTATTHQPQAERIPTTTWNKTRMPTLTFIQTKKKKERERERERKKEIKGIQNGKEEVKCSLYTDDMILHIENPKDSTQKPLDLINEFSKVAG